MTLQQAAQSALDVQNACNACGIVRVLHEIMAEVLIPLGHGTRYVNNHPIVRMYMYKLGELTGVELSSLSEGYAQAEERCRNLASGSAGDGR